MKSDRFKGPLSGTVTTPFWSSKARCRMLSVLPQPAFSEAASITWRARCRTTCCTPAGESPWAG